MTLPRLLMIRPLEQSLAFVKELETLLDRQVQKVISPLTQIEDIPRRFPLGQAQALLFTSANGVRAHIRQNGARDLPALCVGEKTAAVARSAGFVAQSADGTATDLINLALARQEFHAGGFLHVSGEAVAVDLEKALLAHDIPARRVILYRQNPVPLTNEAREILVKHPTIVPIFSPNAAHRFNAETQDLAVKNTTILCISVKCCEPFNNRFENQQIVAEPTAKAMLAALAKQV